MALDSSSSARHLEISFKTFPSRDIFQALKPEKDFSNVSFGFVIVYWFKLFTAFFKQALKLALKRAVFFVPLCFSS